MKEYTVKILDSVFDDIEDIADYIVKVSNSQHAVKYVRELQAEIMSLRFLAGIIPQSRYRTIRQYHPNAKKLRTRNKQLVIIFHIEGDFAIVDKILASKMIIN